MEKRILLDQLSDRIVRALNLLTELYPRLREGTLATEETHEVLDLICGLKALTEAVIDIQYNDNIHKYKDKIYNIARKSDNE